MTQEKLHEMLEAHSKWLRNEEGGMRADLRGANLREANLREADLCGADLCGADLCEANLREADLCGADLCGADLREANLREANLRGADLCGVNLRGADLREANLCEANLRGANGVFVPTACPDVGAFIGWKKCRDNLIVKLQIPACAKRSSATGRKCRCSCAKVLAVQDLDGNTLAGQKAASMHDKTFLYRAGETVSVENFCEDRWNECAQGIHFYITREEAVNYV